MEQFLSSAKTYLSKVKVADDRSSVYKDECAYSFTTPEFAGGLYINLHTLQAVSENFLALDSQRTNMYLYLQQKWKKVKKNQDENNTAANNGGDNNVATADPSKSMIILDEKKWEYEKTYELVCLKPQRVSTVYPHPDLPLQLTIAVEALLKQRDSTAVQPFSLDEERKVSKYVQGLQQLNNGKKISPNPKDWKCEESGKTENLWLNLSTGYIGSGRRNWDGTGGTGAALRHFEETGNRYPLVVKLGTITANGADVYSYAPDEDAMVLDPNLADHLAHWGINMMKMEKTDKTMNELQLDYNMKYEFDSVQENNKQLTNVKGAYLMGLKNTGNSCYLNSVLQVLSHIPEFKSRYLDEAESIFRSSPAIAATDFNTQMAKFAQGVLTEKYVNEAKDDEHIEPQQVPPSFRITPIMLRSVVGREHVEFSTGRQQDAHEYYQHLLQFIKRADRASGYKKLDFNSCFTFDLQQRLECDASHQVRYTTQGGENTLALEIPLDKAINRAEVRAYEDSQQAEEANPVKKAKKEDKEDKEVVVPIIPFQACLDLFFSPTQLNDFYSSATKAKGTATKTIRLGSLPKYLVVQLRRYVMAEDWTPRKINALINIPHTLDLAPYVGHGKQANEVELSSDSAPAAAAAAPVIEPDPMIVAQLVSMGFSENGCKRAAIATKNASADVAMNWVFEHMSDPDFNDPPKQAAAPVVAATNNNQAPVDEESVAMLMSMGFDRSKAEKALRSTQGNVERATEWLFSHADDSMEVEDSSSEQKQQQQEVVNLDKTKYELFAFISHMGPNSHSGHYVCHIKVQQNWIIFNDEKVAISEATPFDKGYLYFFRRIE